MRMRSGVLALAGLAGVTAIAISAEKRLAGSRPTPNYKMGLQNQPLKSSAGSGEIARFGYRTTPRPQPNLGPVNGGHNPGRGWPGGSPRLPVPSGPTIGFPNQDRAKGLERQADLLGKTSELKKDFGKWKLAPQGPTGFPREGPSFRAGHPDDWQHAVIREETPRADYLDYRQFLLQNGETVFIPRSQ